MISLVLGVLSLSASFQAQPQPATKSDTVDRYVAAELAKQHVPGISLAVLRAGKVIKAKGYGMADLENGIAVTPETVFKIGSVSKQFLATGIMLLVQDGKIGLEDPISKYFPGTPDSWQGITVRNFLTHTSGVIREGPAFDPLKVQPDSIVIKSAFEKPLEFPVGSKFLYCNTCYFTLAEIIARVSGKSWDQFVTERIFAPMGMKASRTTTTTDLVQHRAHGYVWRDSSYTNAFEFLALRPSGAFLSTVLDLAKWDAALYKDLPLTAASRREMWAPFKLTDGQMSKYGFGWQLDSLDGHWNVHHGGALPGFRAEMSRFPDDSLTVIVLANADGARPDRIAAGIAKLYLTKVIR